ncbi:hypothetical protein FRB99_006492, partial [Tulasnella sp. 403]
KLWDLTTRQVQKILSFGDIPALGLDISSDDTFCATGYGDGTVLVWDLKNKENSRSSLLNKTAVASIAISPGCELIAVATSPLGVCILNAQTLETLATYNVGNTWTVRFSPDGGLLFGGGWDYITRCWNVTNIRRWKVDEPAGTTIGFIGHQ